MLRLHNIKLPLSYHSKSLIQAAAKALGVSQSAVERCEISKKSVDARKKNDVCFVVALDVTLKNPQDEKRIAARLTPSVGGLAAPYTPPAVIKLERAPDVRPIVVGFGPAGLFAALTLAEAGACPIVLERGQDVDIRTRDVHAYWSRSPTASSTPARKTLAANIFCALSSVSARRMTFSSTQSRTSAQISSTAWSKPCACAFSNWAAKCASARG